MTGDHRIRVKVIRTAGDDRGADREPEHVANGRSPAERIEVDDLELPVLGRRDFITNERALGRPQDLADVARLEEEGKA